uniref:Transcriptional regulator n=1 Tax=Caenorhabditis tropicalis TaxID=1561998 RepID=A0A1I7TCT0_9PELO
MKLLKGQASLCDVSKMLKTGEQNSCILSIRNILSIALSPKIFEVIHQLDSKKGTISQFESSNLKCNTTG